MELRSVGKFEGRGDRDQRLIYEVGRGIYSRRVKPAGKLVTCTHISTFVDEVWIMEP
jgi:hypothetical protein